MTEDDMEAGVATLEELALMLGGINKSIEFLREDFREEKEVSHQSRSTMHKRMDDQSKEIGEVKMAVAMSARDLADAKAAIEAHKDAVMPSVAEWKRMKILGGSFLVLAGIAGVSFVGFLSWAGDVAVTTARAWLKIT